MQVRGEREIKQEQQKREPQVQKLAPRSDKQNAIANPILPAKQKEKLIHGKFSNHGNNHVIEIAPFFMFFALERELKFSDA